AELGLRHHRDQLADIAVVHRVHRSEVRAGHPALQPAAHRLGRQCLDMTRHRIVRLVAMHVDPQAALCGEFAELADSLGAIGHGALEMRDTAHRVDAAVERGDDPLVRFRRRQPAPDRPVAIGERTALDEVGGQRRLASPQIWMPSSRVPDWLCRGTPMLSAVFMWKWASTKGGETSWSSASISGPPAGRPRSMAAIRPALTPISRPTRPSARRALRTTRSKVPMAAPWPERAAESVWASTSRPGGHSCP